MEMKMWTQLQVIVVSQWHWRWERTQKGDRGERWDTPTHQSAKPSKAGRTLRTLAGSAAAQGPGQWHHSLTWFPIKFLAALSLCGTVLGRQGPCRSHVLHCLEPCSRLMKPHCLESAGACSLSNVYNTPFTCRNWVAFYVWNFFLRIFLKFIFFFLSLIHPNCSFLPSTPPTAPNPPPTDPLFFHLFSGKNRPKEIST